jgi:hypothetical protein
VPQWLIHVIYPIDKTNLDMLRLTDFLAAPILISRNLPRDSAGLSSRLLRPAILPRWHCAHGGGCVVDDLVSEPS